MGDREPERLHPIEVLRRMPIDAQCDQFVQPRHQHSGTILTQLKNLSSLGVQSFGKVLRLQAVTQDAGVLPEHLVDHVVGVCVDRGDGDVALGFAAALVLIVAGAKAHHLVCCRLPCSLALAF